MELLLRKQDFIHVIMGPDGATHGNVTGTRLPISRIIPIKSSLGTKFTIRYRSTLLELFKHSTS